MAVCTLCREMAELAVPKNANAQGIGQNLGENTYLQSVFTAYQNNI